MDASIEALSASQIADGVAQSDLKVTQVCQSLLDRVTAREKVGAWVHLNADLVLHEAKRLDALPRSDKIREGGLFGVPVGIKDIFHTKDMPTRHGSHRYKDSTTQFDAAAVEILRKAGCIIMGKTVTTELAFTMNGKHTLNPRNFEISPGGSSSGSAAAVADNQVPIAVGTQTFGSVTRPASYCGIYGWKPTWGLVSTVGGKFCSPTLDTVGFFARDCDDFNRLASVFAITQATQALLLNSLELSQCSVGILIPPGWEDATDDARDVLHQCKNILQDIGAQTKFSELPDSFSQALAHQRLVATKELAHNWTPEGDVTQEDDQMLRNFIAEGQNASYGDYLEALDNLAKLRKEWDTLAGGYTFVISLSATGEAPRGLSYTGDSRFNTLSTALHFPVINVPGLVGNGGNPIGISVMGARGHDLNMIAYAKQVGRAIEEYKQ